MYNSTLPKRPICVDCGMKSATFHVLTPYGIADLCEICAKLLGALLASNLELEKQTAKLLNELSGAPFLVVGEPGGETPEEPQVDESHSTEIPVMKFLAVVHCHTSAENVRTSPALDTLTQMFDWDRDLYRCMNCHSHFYGVVDGNCIELKL